MILALLESIVSVAQLKLSLWNFNSNCDCHWENWGRCWARAMMSGGGFPYPHGARVLTWLWAFARVYSTLNFLLLESSLSEVVNLGIRSHSADMTVSTSMVGELIETLQTRLSCQHSPRGATQPRKLKATWFLSQLKKQLHFPDSALQSWSVFIGCFRWRFLWLCWVDGFKLCWVSFDRHSVEFHAWYCDDIMINNLAEAYYALMLWQFNCAAPSGRLWP